MVIERAPLEERALDPRLQKVLDWFTPEILPSPVQTYVRFNLGQIYEILHGERTISGGKNDLMKEARKMLQEVIDIYYSPCEGMPKLAAKYAIEGEARLADVLLEGASGSFVRPSKAMACLTHLSDGESFNRDPRRGYRMRSALIFLAQEMIAREQASQK